MKKARHCFMSIALSCAGMLVGPHAAAGQLICKHHSLQTHDRNDVLVALKRKIGQLEIEKKETFYCRNPGSAIAWFVTKRVQDADGAFSHVLASCDRDRRNWSCETHSVRTIDFRFDLKSKVGAISIPQDMTPGYANSLFRKADALAKEQITPERQCSRMTNEAFEYALSVRSSYLSKDNVDGSEITINRARTYVGNEWRETGLWSIMVVRDFAFVEFESKSRFDAIDDLKFKCWDVQIVVG